jgi:hypothetical protein
VDVEEAVLLALSGSVVLAETVAVLIDWVEELKVLAVALIVITTEPPTLIEPKEQLTVVVEAVYVQDPWLVEAAA